MVIASALDEYGFKGFSWKAKNGGKGIPLSTDVAQDRLWFHALNLYVRYVGCSGPSSGEIFN